MPKNSSCSPIHKQFHDVIAIPFPSRDSEQNPRARIDRSRAAVT